MLTGEDIQQLDHQLNELITRYEHYFSGLEKREPLQLRKEIETTIRRSIGSPIHNTMHNHRFTTVVARFNTYLERWNRILRLMDEGKYTRGASGHKHSAPEVSRLPSDTADIDRIYRELSSARQSCNLPPISREALVATLNKQKPALTSRLGTNEITIRVVIEDGKPKLKAAPRTDAGH